MPGERRKPRWRDSRSPGSLPSVEVDLHQLELRHRDLRIHDGEQRRRLIGSVAEIGQQVPVVVIHDAERLVLIDGYLRVEALRRLHRDTAIATTWPVSEIEALVHHRHLAGAKRAALEDAWLRPELSPARRPRARRWPRRQADRARAGGPPRRRRGLTCPPTLGEGHPTGPPPRPDRIRRIAGGFAFVPNDFLHHGFFAQLSHPERSLYFFLVLAADRNGVSFYAHDRICAALELTLDDYLVVRDRLIDLDLIAFDGTQFQVLSLPPAPIAPPPRPLVTQDDFEGHDTATIRRLIQSSRDRRR
jgi:hypothetical protein